MGEYDEFNSPPPSSASAGEFSEFDAPQGGAAQPVGRSFLQRAADTVKAGAHAVATVGKDVGHYVAETYSHPVESFLHPLETARRSPLADPVKRRQLERGIDDVTTLGYGQKFAARVGNALGDTPDVAIGPETFGGGIADAGGAPVANTQAADAAAAPEYRTAGNMAGMFMPGAASAIGKTPGLVLRGVGELAPEAVQGAARLGAAAVEKAGHVPLVGRFLAPVAAGAGGAARGLAEYETTAPVVAAASAGAEGHRKEAAKEAATDPLGVLTSTIGGALPAGAGETARQARQYVEHAPAASDAWIINDIRGQRAGDSTPTARKYLAADENDVQAVVKSDPELRQTLAAARHGDKGKLEQASAAVDRKISDINAPRAEAYDTHVDGALGGGIRAGDFIQDIRNQAAELRAGGTAGGHKMAKYLEARADELEQSRAWGAETRHQPAAGTADDLAALEQVRGKVRDPASARAIDEQIAALKAQGRQVTAHNPDALVPTRVARAVVSDIQDAAFDGLGGLSDTRAAGQARHVAGIVKDVFDKYLDRAAQADPNATQAVDQIRAINTQHSALKNIQRVIDERLNKATQGAHGAGIPMAGRNIVRHLVHGNLPLAAGYEAMHGHPGIAAAMVGAAALPVAKRALDTHVAGHQGAYLAAVDRLARAARASDSASEFVRGAVAAGLGVEDARRIWDRAHGRAN